MPLLLILDSLGTSELMLILGVALIFFGPRKLPQISRQIGKSLAEFRKASEDFKSTWAREVALEAESQPEPKIWPPDHSNANLGTVERHEPVHHTATESETQPPIEIDTEPQLDTAEAAGLSATSKSAMPEPARKSDWF